LQGGGRIELATGQVWPDAAFEDGSVLSEEEEDELEDPGKWLADAGYYVRKFAI
jgi:hypothetical protein